MDRDLSRSRAILIGNAVYQHSNIPDLSAARTCVSAMADLLPEELCGWPPDRITSLVDVAAPHDLARRVVAEVRTAEDVLLVYYVGHGMRTSEGQLALALGVTDPDPEALPHTAMLYENLAKMLRASCAPTKLVILDCCHAELANKANYLFQAGDVAEAYPVDGLYFIGASARDKKAKAPVGGTLTYFTDAFLRVVRSGIPRGPSTLRLDQIFLELRGRLMRENLPEPVESGMRGARQFPFARNAAPPETYLDPEEEIAQLRREKADIEIRARALQAEVAKRDLELQSLRDAIDARTTALGRSGFPALREVEAPGLGRSSTPAPALPPAARRDTRESELLTAARKVDRWRGQPSASRISRDLGIGMQLATVLANYLRNEDDSDASAADRSAGLHSHFERAAHHAPAVEPLPRQSVRESELLIAARKVERWQGQPSATRISRELGIGMALATALANALRDSDETGASTVGLSRGPVHGVGRDTNADAPLAPHSARRSTRESELVAAARGVERWRGQPSATRISRELGIGMALANYLAATLRREEVTA